MITPLCTPVTQLEQLGLIFGHVQYLQIPTATSAARA